VCVYVCVCVCVYGCTRGSASSLALKNGLGIFLVILGSGYYSRVRYVERMERMELERASQIGQPKV
jgi:hypothetical protein